VNIYSSAAENMVVDLGRLLRACADGPDAGRPVGLGHLRLTTPPSGSTRWAVSNRRSTARGVRVGRGRTSARLYTQPVFSHDHLSAAREHLADGGGPVKQLAGSLGTTYDLRNDGTVLAWGSNSYGEIGDGTHSQPGAPIFVDVSLSPPYTVGVSPSGQTQITDVALIGAA